MLRLKEIYRVSVGKVYIVLGYFIIVLWRYFNFNFFLKKWLMLKFFKSC